MPPGTTNLKATLGSLPDLTAINLNSPIGNGVSPTSTQPDLTKSEESLDDAEQLMAEEKASPKGKNKKKAVVKENSDEEDAQTCSDPEDPEDEIVIPYKELKIEKHLAKGGFKDVYRGQYKGEDVAIGMISTGRLSEADLQDIQNELNLLRQLRHDNIVQFIGLSKIWVNKLGKKVCSRFCIVTEFCPYGDLADYMRGMKMPSIQRQLALMYDIAFGLSYLHNRRPDVIIHRDLKSTNILVDKDERAKIADFGLAKVKTKAKKLMMHSVVGTLNWQAPEMWCEKPVYSEKVDVYSTGLIFWEVLKWDKTFPFDELNDFEIYQQVGKEGLRPSWDGIKAPKQLIELIDNMWAQDSKQRPSMSDVVETLNDLMK